MMNNARKEFRERTIKTIEDKITLLLDWVNESSTSDQDKRTTAAIESLTATRAALLAEQAASDD